jgi:thiosulfate/3-mercaptopyruvate sulfurtransferase
MKTTMMTRWMATITFALPALAAAAEPARQGSPLIAHEELQKRLSDPKVRLLDARPRADYDKGHIPGAVWIDGKALQDLAKPDAFADQAAWSRVLTPLGLVPEAEVYIYDAARQHDAARAWWLLAYAGVPKVGLVDGGFALWERQGRPVTSEVSSVQPREFAVRFHPERVALRADVQSTLKSGDAQILDARSAKEYRGEGQAPTGGRAGHIPTARSLEAYGLVDGEGRFLDDEAQRTRLAKAGLSSDRPVIAYSQGGARSALIVFALERQGVPVRHYAQGLGEWSKDASAPIAAGAEPGSVR